MCLKSAAVSRINRMVSEVPNTMHVWRKYKGNTEPVWEEIPVPKPAPNEILCKILASGVCRSDHSLLNMDNQPGWFQESYTLGHEGCGEIVQLGDQVKGFSMGDVVALHAVPGCGNASCPECSRDLSQICETGHHSGIGQDGFHAPYAKLDFKGAVVVPEGVTPAEAAVATDAVCTAYHGINKRAEVKNHETVFLFGLGGLGLNALQIVLEIGTRIIVCDVRQECLDEARALGVPEEDIVPIGKAPQKFVTERGLNIDTVLDFVGTHQTFDDAQYIVRRGGKLLCIGSLDTENTIHMKIGTRKRLSFIFSYGGQVQDLREVLGLVSKRVINPRVEERNFKDFPQILKELVDGKIKSRVALVHN